MRLSRSCLLAFACFMWLIGCKAKRTQLTKKEVILCSLSSRRPFSDRIIAIRADGSDPKTVLSATAVESYISVQSNKASRLLLIQVRSVDSESRVRNQLRLFEPATSQWRDVPKVTGPTGVGILAPDESAAVAEVGGSSSGVMQSSLWLLHFRAANAEKLTDSVAGQRDTFPNWSRDGKSVAFLRVRRMDKGLISRLFIIDLNTRQTSEPTGAEGLPVAAACYRYDRERLFLLTATGLEVLSLDSGVRSTITKWSEFQGRKYNSGGIAWSNDLGAVVLALWNENDRKTEIWTFPVDGHAPSILFRTGPDEDIRSLTIAEQ